MLVLTRRPEETICIGPKIRITVLAVKGERVRLGLDAPPEVPIRREELEAYGSREDSATISNHNGHRGT